MREIKFRQPQFTNDDKFHNWHYWGFIGGASIGPTTGWSEGHHQQYTGLKDKNGKEIYEGDLLGMCGINGSFADAEVFWFDGAFMVRHLTGEKNVDDIVYHKNRCEVIGNIWEGV